MLDMANVIEPAAGAAARVGAGERRADMRGGVHQLWASSEYRNVWWVVPLDALGHSGVRDPASIDTARALLRRINQIYKSHELLAELGTHKLTGTAGRTRRCLPVPSATQSLRVQSRPRAPRPAMAAPHAAAPGWHSR